MRMAVTADMVRSGLQAGTMRARNYTVCLVNAAEGVQDWRAQVCLLRCRAHGFMVLTPDYEEIRAALEDWEGEDEAEGVVISEVDCPIESSRGALLGTVGCFICDIPWSYLPLFRKPPVRGLGAGAFTFELNDVQGRPVWEEARQVAQQWISEVLDGSTANEYMSAVEEPAGPEQVDDDEELLPAAAPTGRKSALRNRKSELVPPTDTEALHVRIAQLESLLSGQRDQQAEARRDELGRSSILGAGGGDPLSAHEWDVLRDAVGSAPTRVGRHEAIKHQPAHPAPETVVEAEVEKEVAELEGESAVLAAELKAGLGQSGSDPLQRMLLLQLHQTNQLVKALAPKSQSDPLSAMLSGGDNGSGSSSGGSVNVKGYAAREVFLKQILEDKKVIETVRSNARTELGIGAAREEPSLLRNYLEQRVPTGDHKTLIQVGYMLAAGWEIGAEQNNIALMAFAARMMIYVEQACLDGGRTQLAWLMTGLSEPNFQQLSVNRRRSTLTPFSRLASPTWIAANVSYLRDIDVFETRLKQIGVVPKPTPPPPDPDDKGGKWKRTRKEGKKGDEAPPEA